MPGSRFIHQMTILAWHQAVKVHFSRSKTRENPSPSSPSCSLHNLLKVPISLPSWLPQIFLAQRYRHFYSQRRLRALIRMFKRKLSKMTSVSCFLQKSVLSLKLFNCFYSAFFKNKTFSHIFAYYFNYSLCILFSPFMMSQIISAFLNTRKK